MYTSRCCLLKPNSVVFDGSDIRGGNETLPFATTFQDDYVAAIADVEQRVLSYNTRNHMLTCAVRHHNLYGPGDQELIPAIVASAKEPRVQLVGNGTNLVDFSYAGNVAHAHLLAGERLQPGTKVAGMAWIVTDGQPVPYMEFVNAVLTGNMHYYYYHVTLHDMQASVVSFAVTVVLGNTRCRSSQIG
jgi:2-alkyl-3-oxoalkanoate reductase